MYSQISNTRGGSNKRVDWNFSSNLISGQALITAGRVEKFSFVQVKKQGGWKLINGQAKITLGRMENFLKILFFLQKKKQRTNMISSDEDDESDDEEKAREEMQGFIAVSIMY